MRHILLCLLILPALLLGCQTGAPEVAPRAPYLDPGSDMEAKAAAIHSQTMALVDASGLLMYRAYEPLDDPENLLLSHDVADMPAWHGVLMAALAFEEAATGQDRDAEIKRLAEGLQAMMRTTGTPGLLGRSAIPDYKGPRLKWMDTRESRPTKYWLQGPTGGWWRCGLAKGHLNQAMFGCAIPLALSRRGELELSEDTRQALLAVLLPVARRLADNDFVIIDHDGEPTEFGNLGPQLLNGFNMAVCLHILASAAPYDRRLARIYDEKVYEWSGRMGTSLSIVGDVIDLAGHAHLEKPSFSDMQQMACAATSLLLQERERGRVIAGMQNALRGLWSYVRYERNVPYTLIYAACVDAEGCEPELLEALEDLRDFPIDKRPRAQAQLDTLLVQPLANRPLNTHYWKSSPYRIAVGEPGELLGQVFSGQDYLLGYWMGRYFKLIPAR